MAMPGRGHNPEQYYRAHTEYNHHRLSTILVQLRVTYTDGQICHTVSKKVETPEIRSTATMTIIPAPTLSFHKVKRNLIFQEVSMSLEKLFGVSSLS